MNVEFLDRISFLEEFCDRFSLSLFTFIKRLFSFFSISGIRVVPSTYLRLLISLPAILNLTCASFSLAFHIMYTACKLNKQGDNIQSDVLLSQFVISPLFYPVLTVAS